MSICFASKDMVGLQLLQGDQGGKIEKSLDDCPVQAGGGEEDLL